MIPISPPWKAKISSNRVYGPPITNVPALILALTEKKADTYDTVPVDFLCQLLEDARTDVYFQKGVNYFGLMQVAG